MRKTKLSQPILIYMYGLPGSGKSFVARQLSELVGMAHLNSDRIKSELFESPQHDKTEYRIVSGLMNFMTEQFLQSGAGVIYDLSVSRFSDRRNLRDLARKHEAKEMMIWVQTDVDTSWQRASNRDHRKADDKYSSSISKEVFDYYMKSMQNPTNENYLVVSGKHLFQNQQSSILRRMIELGVLDQEALGVKIVKPGLVNLVSKAGGASGRVDLSRRNVIIR